MRHISFYLTQDQVRSRQKTVTRRNGWAHAVKGMLLLGVVKGQGLRKGEKVQELCIIEITGTRVESLNEMTNDLEYGLQEVVKEGFPEMSPAQFVSMYCEHNASEPHQWVRRIEFRYRDDIWGLREMGKLTLRPMPRQFLHPQFFPPQSQEPMMAAKGTKKPDTDKPKKPGKGESMVVTSETPGQEKTSSFLDETQVNSEKDQVDKAIAGAGSMERPGVPSQPEFSELAPTSEAEAGVRRLPETRTYTHPLEASEHLPTFQLCVFQEYTESEYAVKGKELAAMDTEIGLLDKEMKDVIKDWKERIGAVESRRSALSANINSKGQEKDVLCSKRINEVTGKATIFNVDSLEVVEERQLTTAELQTELLLRNANASSKPKGAKVVKGNFPKDKIVGGSAKENPELDEANEAALKALAEDAE